MRESKERGRKRMERKGGGSQGKVDKGRKKGGDGRWPPGKDR